jgi:uncharacterized protein (UPF0261 family)
VVDIDVKYAISSRNTSRKEMPMNKSAAVLLVATMDTKGEEALFLAGRLRSTGIAVHIMDGGIRGESPAPVDIDRHQVAAAGGHTLEEVQAFGNEGDALSAMIAGAAQCARELFGRGTIGGVIALGGSMGTTLGTAVMRSLPIGIPKLMISTMASRDTRAFVDTKDIMMLHAVSDLAGLNRITRSILHNGAMAMAGMAARPAQKTASQRPLVAVSTLGTTEACMQQIRADLEQAGCEAIIFHTVGAGGKAMEELVRDEAVAAVVDLSLHEMADHRFGGDYDAGPDRGAAALVKGVPAVLVPGNIDFLVTGPLKTAQARFPGRPHHVHNAAITVVRTDPAEMAALGRRIARLCNTAKGPLKILVPTEGFSAFDSPGSPLFNPEGRRMFVEALQAELTSGISVERIPCHVNDAEFAQAAIRSLEEIMTA